MAIEFILSAAGIIFGIAGSVVLSFSLNKLTDELVLCLRFVDTTVGALVSSQNISRFTGIETRLKGGVTSAKKRTYFGLLLLATGFTLQLIALFLQFCTNG